MKRILPKAVWLAANTHFNPDYPFPYTPYGFNFLTHVDYLIEITDEKKYAEFLLRYS